MKYSTEDFCLATTLHALGAKYISHTRDGNDKITFHFAKNEELERVIPAFYRDEICVSPQKFSYSQKFLKSIIHSQ